MKLTKCVKLKLLIPYMDIIFEVVDHIKGLLSDIYTNSVFDDQDQNEQVKTFYDKYIYWNASQEPNKLVKSISFGRIILIII